MELAIKAFSLINYLSPLLWQYVMVRVVRVTLITEVVLLGKFCFSQIFQPQKYSWILDTETKRTTYFFHMP
jgi:hypothetical protein